MDVEERTARAAGRMSEYQGKTSFFYFDQCKRNFDKKPESSVGKTAELKRRRVLQPAVTSSWLLE
jgi:YHS domain-containing protein